MRNEENASSIAGLNPDFMGFIFYRPSPRDVSNSLTPQILNAIPDKIIKVAVFVNETLEKVMDIIKSFDFTHVQLHGDESLDYCIYLKERGITVIKVFSIQTASDFEQTGSYSSVCDFFLFDTKSPKHGGTGQKFDWNLLENYKGNTPVLLSGGIAPDDVEIVKEIRQKFPFIKGLDLNSKFEISPAVKDPEKLQNFINSVK